MASMKTFEWIRSMLLFLVLIPLTQLNGSAQVTDGREKGAPVEALTVDPLAFSRLDQGRRWQADDWNAFYTEDQGSWIMPYSWITALRQPDGLLFLRNSMSRYGLIPNRKNTTNPEGLPVGFLVANRGTKNQQFAMTCAACHTRQITVDSTTFRVDGGPAFADMDRFFRDLISAVNHTMTNEKAFRVFQRSVTTPSADLMTQLRDWYALNGLVYGQTLPKTPWGIGRLDAVSSINNRVTAGYLGTFPNFLIPANIATASVPVRFPFLWNADRQDLTQWAGTSVNGNHQYALQRNAVEASGVWSLMHPVNGNYLAVNTLNYPGLVKIGTLTPKIGPPKWPWRIDRAKASRGEFLYEVNCSSCHGVRPGEPRPPVYDTWRTDVVNVGTDTAYYGILARTANSSGLLGGTVVPLTNPPAVIPANGFSSFTLVKSLTDNALLQRFPGIDLSLSPPAMKFGAYEARVLQGIWAAAPYLHNGSVPTLADLLKPAGERTKSFEVGPVYDLKKVGLAAKQPGGRATVRSTTDASDLNSGDSNAGHEYGVWLPEADKEALLEYLKRL